MSIPVLDSANNGATSTAAATLTWSHTCAGSNRYLFVALFFNGAVSGLTVTYNGVSMTQVNTVTDATRNAYLFGLVNPATGVNTVSVGWTTSRAVIATSVSYTDVNQSVPLGTGVTATNTTSPTSGSIDLTSNDIGIGLLASHNSANNSISTITSSGAGQTDRTTQSFAGASTAARIRQADITGTGTVSMAWTSTGVERFLIAYPLKGTSLGSVNFFAMF